MNSRQLAELNKLLQFRTFIKDPIHGVIRLNSLETNIVNSPVFIRLHGIKQLGFTYLVYPQAKHSRFEHSLGSMHTAGIIAETILTQPDKEIQEMFSREHERRLFVELFRIAALLHDLGHLPYSHATEMALTKLIKEGYIEGDIIKDYELSRTKNITLHEALTCNLIKKLIERQFSKEKLSAAIIEAGLKVLCDEDVHEYWQKLYTYDITKLVRNIISNRITDIDKIEYLVRDAYNTGAKFGLIDVERLLSSVKLVKVNNSIKLVIPEKLLSNIEDLFYARYMMYKYVYLHHRVIAVETCYEMALRNVLKSWEKIRKSILPVFQKTSITFGDIFSSEKIYDLAFNKGILVDDSLVDLMLRVAYTKAKREERPWFEAILLRKKILNPIFKREATFFTFLKTSDLSKSKSGIDPIEIIKKIYSSYESPESFERVLSDELSKISGCRCIVRAIPPITYSKGDYPLVYVNGLLEKIDDVSPFISAIEKAGEAPTIFIFVTGKCDDKSAVANNFVKVLTKLASNLT